MEPPASARMEIKPPKLLTGGAVLAVCFYGVLLMVPGLLSALAVCILPLCILTWLIPLATVAVATWFLPFGFGNPLIARLARSLAISAADGSDCFVVQVTLTPRLRKG